uniref:Uncharacterized protein n=1 Tax=Rhizophora mucronata TaxID=61149 RepID=A0A2P2IZ34_RHIMU
MICKVFCSFYFLVH